MGKGESWQGLEEKVSPEYVGRGSWMERVAGNKNMMYSLEKKYLVRNGEGEVIETPPEAVYRMARTMAEVESQYGKAPEEVDGLTKDFYFM
ncbi:MAG: hypothetical protein BV456_12975, partial [Thermoplasmata archaeon M8B2D]